MGGARTYNPGGGFSRYDYHQVGETFYVDGLKGKVVAKRAAGGKDDSHSALPSRSDTSDFYVNVGKSGDVVQVKFFKDRLQSADFDWGHDHRDRKTNKYYPDDVIHIQTYNSKGARTGLTRFMNNAEMKRFGAFLKSINPKVKFRP